MKIEKLDGFTADGFGKVIGGAADLVDGDVERIDGKIEQRYYAPVAPPPPAPPVLTKTGFQDHAVKQLGGNSAGMKRFMLIIEATRTSTDAAVRFVAERYDAATTFQKDTVQTLTTMLVAAGIMQHGEADAILANWPK